jgi:hypothetical protein
MDDLTQRLARFDFDPIDGLLHNPRDGEWVKAAEAAARIEALEAEVARLRDGLERQGDNMAFVLNHASLPEQWDAKFTLELAEDRAALTPPHVQHTAGVDGQG